MRDEVAELVGGAARIEMRRPNALVRMARSATGGQPQGVDLIVSDDTRGLPPFTVSLPDADDLVAAAIAESITTAVALRARFGPALAALRTMSFDVADPGMQSGHFGGLAHLNLATAHLNAGYVTASGRERFAQRGAARHLPSIVAHELWHLVELAWETRDYGATIHFRGEVGRYFGVATIEHAVRGDERAKNQLRTEVSAYATTSPKEATAEMFEQWWTRDEVSPAVAYFGALVDRYFPAPA